MKRSDRGFTLIDIALAITLIGLLSAMAYPRFSAATARAKRVEARFALSAIWRAQKAQWLQSGNYTGTFRSLSLSLSGETVISPTQIKGKYYTFTLTQPWGADSYYVVAEGNIDHDPMTDLLVIYEIPPPGVPAP